MNFVFHKTFKKKLGKRSSKEKEHLKSRLKLFLKDHYNPILNNHALNGKYDGCRSINVTGDLRAVYVLQEDGIALFVDIDNHPNLYK